MEAQQLQDQCQQLVPQILADRGWQLVQDETAFIEEVNQEVERRLKYMRPAQEKRRPLGKVIENATINRYNHVWYEACQVEGGLRQYRAYTEIYEYLYTVVWHRIKPNITLAEESAHEALIMVWKDLHQVRDPGSFMSWASTIARHELAKKIAKVERRRNHEILEIDRTSGETREGHPSPVTELGFGAGQQWSNIQPELTDERLAEITAIIQYCLRRSKQRQQVIIGLFLKGKSVLEMANQLEIKPDNVNLLKSRALRGLRKCPEFLQLVEEE